MNLPEGIDPRLRITIGACPVEHYLSYNPHTFRGRIATWCPLDSLEVNVSKFEVRSGTDEALYWIEGFLAGNEPPRPRSDDPAAEGEWQNIRREFLATGDMPREA